MKTRLVIGVSILAFLCVGCGGFNGHIPATPSTNSGSTVHVNADNDLVNLELPFTPYAEVIRSFTAGYDGPIEADPQQRHDLFEAFTAQCMKERGFDYYPLEWTSSEDSPGFFPQGDKLWLPDLPTDRDSAILIGYGVKSATSPYVVDGTSDQNSHYRDTLNYSAQTEYDLALMGRTLDSVGDSGYSNSCRGLAAERYPAQFTDVNSDPRTAFQERYHELSLAMYLLVIDDIFNDPRMVVLNKEWRGCVTSLGYNLESGSLFTEDNITPWATYILALSTRSDGSLGESWYNYMAEELTPEEEKSLLGTDAERKIAIDDFECREQVDYMKRYLEIQVSLEKEFIAQHNQQLKEMMAFAEQYR